MVHGALPEQRLFPGYDERGHACVARPVEAGLKNDALRVAAEDASAAWCLLRLLGSVTTSGWRRQLRGQK